MMSINLRAATVGGQTSISVSLHLETNEAFEKLRPLMDNARAIDGTGSGLGLYMTGQIVIEDVVFDVYGPHKM